MFFSFFIDKDVIIPKIHNEMERKEKKGDEIIDVILLLKAIFHTY